MHLSLGRWWMARNVLTLNANTWKGPSYWLSLNAVSVHPKRIYDGGGLISSSVFHVEEFVGSRSSGDPGSRVFRGPRETCKSAEARCLGPRASFMDLEKTFISRTSQTNSPQRTGKPKLPYWAPNFLQIAVIKIINIYALVTVLILYGWEFPCKKVYAVKTSPRFGDCYTCFSRDTGGGAYISVSFQDRPAYSQINEKLSPRLFDFC